MCPACDVVARREYMYLDTRSFGHRNDSTVSVYHQWSLYRPVKLTSFLQCSLFYYVWRLMDWARLRCSCKHRRRIVQSRQHVRASKLVRFSLSAIDAQISFPPPTGYHLYCGSTPKRTRRSQHRADICRKSTGSFSTDSAGATSPLAGRKVWVAKWRAEEVQCISHRLTAATTSWPPLQSLPSVPQPAFS